MTEAGIMGRVFGRFLMVGFLSAGWGCARLHGGTPAMETRAHPPKEELAAQGKATGCPDLTAPGYAEQAERKPAGNRLPHHNASQVREMQDEELQQQREGVEEGVLRESSALAGWLDRTHETWFRRMDNAVRTVDVRWFGQETDYYPELSTFRVRALTRVGGTDNQKDAEVKLDFRADLALPWLEHKLRLILESVDSDSLPGADIMSRSEHTQLGLQTMWHNLLHGRTVAGAGMRLRGGRPVGYLSLQWKWDRELGGGTLNLNPRVMYLTDDGLGQVAALSWTRFIRERQCVQLRVAERTSEAIDGVNLEYTVRSAWLRSGRGRGWVAQASVFPTWYRSDWTWDDTLLNVTWRDAFYRRWIYYTITPQLQFPREDHYRARPSIRFGLEILFGGRIANLI